MRRYLSLFALLFALLVPFAGKALAADFPAASVLFETGKTEISADGNAAIAAVAEHLKANAGDAVQLSGFTDSTGDATANAELAKNRAVAVRDALVAAGVAT